MTDTSNPLADARAAIVARYGSEAAALALCDRERTLRELTWHLVMPGSPETGPSLSGWRDGPATTMTPEVRRDVSNAIRRLAGSEEAAAEAAYWTERAETRATLNAGPLPVWVRARRAILAEIIGTSPPSASPTPPPALSPPATPSEPDPAVEAGSEPEELPEAGSGQDPAGDPEPVQSGQRLRTREEARAAVRALLGEGLTDREIARRVDVSPTTVAAVRKASA